MTKAQILAKLGLGKDVPVTAQNLSEAFPEVIGEIAEAAHTAGAASVDQKAIGSAAVAAALEGIMALATAFFGAANAEKFKTLMATGVTPDQIKALGIVPEAAAESEEERKRKADLLAGIQAAGANNPGSGGGNSGSKEFTALVAAYQTEHKCSRIDAIRATANAHPEAHAAYIRLVNAKKEK